MSRTLRPLVALALVALISLISAGCGSNAPSEAGAASNSGSGSNSGAAGGAGSAGSTGTGGNENATARDKAVKFSACMRGNGVPDFPDPDASGEFPTFGVSVSPAVWQKAVGACKALQPPGSLSGNRSPEQQSAALEFAQCVRENGVKDFPDPVNGEPLIDTTRIPSSEREGGMSILNAAVQKCGDVLGEAMGGRR
jgi:hypothetical protein